MSFPLTGVSSSATYSYNTQVNDSEAFIKFAKKGNTKKILELLKQGIGINTTDCHGNTALMEAIYNYRTDTAKVLIENGADLNMQNNLPFGKTALINAVERDLEDMVIALINKGAYLDIQDISGQTALIKAAQHGYTTIAKILIANGANITIKEKTKVSGLMIPGEYGRNALMIAAQNGHAEIITALIEKGASLDEKTEGGDTALTLCIESCSTALFSRDGYIQTAKALIENGADINIQNNRRDTPLILAKRFRIGEIVQMLKDKNALKYPENPRIDYMDIE